MTSCWQALTASGPLAALPLLNWDMVCDPMPILSHLICTSQSAAHGIFAVTKILFATKGNRGTDDAVCRSGLV